MPRRTNTLKSSLAAILAGTLLAPNSIAAVEPETRPHPFPLVRARALLDSGETHAAVTMLEEGLASDKEPDPALVDLLRRAYAEAALKADAQGRVSDAELFRDNLEILNHRRPAATLGANAQAPPEPPAAEPISDNDPLPGPLEVPSPDPIDTLGAPETLVQDPKANTTLPSHLIPLPVEPDSLPAPAPLSPPQRLAAPPRLVAPGTVPTPQTTQPPAVESADLAEADAAFLARKYEEAGKLYAALDQEGRLPLERRDHWAYCRCAAVVRRINARPAKPQDWAEIDAEIQRIRELSPNNWYAEYLRNRASERSRPRLLGRRAANKSNRLVVRGSAPDDPPRIAPPDLKKPDSAPTQNVQAGPILAINRATEAESEPLSVAAGPAPGVPSRPATPPGSGASIKPSGWQIHETASFRIHHHDPELAEKAAGIAEAARESQIKRWTAAMPRAAWVPKCEVYLYPDARTFSQMTGQPEDSPGFSTMGMNGGKIIARRVNLRVDHPNMLTAILPHEITHVMLADLFPHQQIPRWADEGMAVLSEPASEQHLRATDLDQPLSTGQLFKLDDLMKMDYPDSKFWGLYYAQSVSLTRYLVEQAGPTQFIQFVQRAQINGIETELRRVYKIEGYADLQKRWMAYARTQSNERTASREKVTR